MTQKLSRRRDDSVTKTSLVKVVDYVRRIITIENYFFFSSMDHPEILKECPN